MNLFTIPPGVPFLDALAVWWLGREADPLRQSEGLFILPTRRSVRALAEAFLRAANGQALLLPRMVAMGALDEAPFALAEALSLPPAVAEPVRLAALTRLVLRLNGSFGAPETADRAWLLAAELARLLDEAHREGVALEQALPGLVEGGHAQHWVQTLQFLQIVTAHWPQWLADNGVVDGAARGVALLAAQAAAWAEAPPTFPVVVAGTSGGIRAAADLMRVVARLPHGRVVLPGLDLGMADKVWADLQESHPQAGLQRLLLDMNATRGDVRALGEPGARAETVRRALLPAQALSAWRDGFVPRFTPDVAGMERLEAADQQEEAVAIALVLRQALEAPNARAALVTPDRALAARVAAELGRFQVVVDDSAGEKLGDTPPGAFMRLLVQTVAEGLGPVSLLAVLKHPLATLGLVPADCRRRARGLERLVLRGPAPPPGLAGLRAALMEKLAGRDEPVLLDLIDRIEARFGPLLALAKGPDVPLEEALRALVAAAEAVAETASTSGAARLWALEEGEALAVHLAALLAALPLLPPQPVSTLPGLLDASLEGAVVRSRRALRGRDGHEHPRVAILGLLEARLQSFDVLVLGSLAEAVWPAAADPGPWMSRSMRRDAKLASPEAAVGQMAHDFAQLACAAPRVVLSCPRRRDGAPTVPARWLVRLEAMLTGYGAALVACPAAEWARQLDQPDGPPQAVSPPKPCPPVHVRPRRMSVSDVETWLRDPYGLYAKHILRLRALKPLDEAVENSDFGNVVHTAIAAWVQALPATYPPDAAARLRAAMEVALAGRVLRPALLAWWRPRLGRIADWVAEVERGRRFAHPRPHVAVEVSGTWAVPLVEFELQGRADRIERLSDGRLALLDYKTGVVPSAAAVLAGHAPQLPLEAAMAAAGAFGPALRGEAGELAYWALTGSYVPGKVTMLFEKKGSDKKVIAEEVEKAAVQFAALVALFDRPDQAYLSQPHPGVAPRFTDYAQLARVAEWLAAEEGE